MTYIKLHIFNKLTEPYHIWIISYWHGWVFPFQTSLIALAIYMNVFEIQFLSKRIHYPSSHLQDPSSIFQSPKYIVLFITFLLNLVWKKGVYIHDLKRLSVVIEVAQHSLLLMYRIASYFGIVIVSWKESFCSNDNIWLPNLFYRTFLVH